MVMLGKVEPADGGLNVRHVISPERLCHVAQVASSCSIAAGGDLAQADGHCSTLCR
ncbi:hypothetical protein BAUCODRAFT_36549 [Baudoinia panamericana UAMH 10762]|uniref:Uncharacterized protein n=1 Tax=Baudoinia panamericana (strain UAMH 10762) TaxID=717646 RepID=M2N4Y0_BAUPA|nr:uncharacterized protein BAUCODRAFT_36549 [Baudoinia panamericana UAMH 10762]EMC94074.1 hypothetical protein BAUCODRAFT_36549 [Baudoinia panamericana UAMH 10762]